MVHIILPISLRNVSLCRFKCLQRNNWRLHFDMRFFPQRNGVLSVQWNISSSNQKSFQINSFILDLNFFQSAPIENLFPVILSSLISWENYQWLMEFHSSFPVIELLKLKNLKVVNGNECQYSLSEILE